ncbi:hypothetical protein K0B96_06435 [Horticoccus luteus]|uniref:Uncharacterized protein n=1 Tax=Horticoccus luteus TaxID=2862869 RepID=A0A8F9TYC6_9BACT|nr:hypothetical protein [Horticoccus luteus]QYM80247.1 hypothetical protein K0B96_06435 [Horticoccus luteus]
MDILGQYLDERDDQRRDQAEADERWMCERAGIDPAERLLAWDRWLVSTLQKALQWPADPVRRSKLVRQCAAEITGLAKQLRGRGWLLDGDALAKHVRGMLAPLAAAQRAGKIDDFWPYFRAAVGRYVGAHAEEIQAHARRTGADDGAQSFGAVLAGLGITAEARQRRPSLTELLADRAGEVAQVKRASLRDRTARARAREAACNAAAGQAEMPL